MKLTVSPTWIVTFCGKNALTSGLYFFKLAGSPPGTSLLMFGGGPV